MEGSDVCFAFLFKWNQQFHVSADQQCDNEKVELTAEGGVWADLSPSVNCCSWGDPEQAEENPLISTPGRWGGH